MPHNTLHVLLHGHQIVVKPSIVLSSKMLLNSQKKKIDDWCPSSCFQVKFIPHELTSMDEGGTF